MVPPRSLALRLVLTGVVFLAVALASITVSLWVTWQLEGGAAAVNEAGRLRMMTYRMAFNAAEGRRTELGAHTESFERTLNLLRDGDPSRPLFVPASDETQEAFTQVRSSWAEFLGSVAPAAQQRVDAERAHALVRSIDRLVGAIEHRLAYWTAALRTFQLAMAALAVVGAVLLLYTSHVLVLEPLRRVGAAIASLRAGNLGVRVAPPSTDELRELADGFNTMAERLQGQYASLEEKVRVKTADLQAQRERLAALYEVSAFVAQAETLDELSKGFVKLVRTIARADGVALRWSDEDNQRYVMLAQEGLPPAFAALEQCLPTGDCHCGQAAGSGRSRIIPIRRDDDSRGHCAKAGFETLMTVPVALHHRVHGEIDLFYRSPAGSAQPDRSLLELLASHLAGGMEALRSAAAEKEAAVSTERALLAQELHDSIAQALAFLKIQVQLLRSALGRRDEAAVDRTVAEIETGVLESYGDVRELLLHFRTRADAEDIEPALRTTLRKFQLQTGLDTSVEVTGHGVALPNDVQVQVLHIVQEALSNVRKHAGATAVQLKVQQVPAWTFTVSDDGRGFDTAGQVDEDHVGLRIMAERAARIGARLQVNSQPGLGTTVQLTLASGEDAPVIEHALTHQTVGG
jgi:two-component system nitrate/nitrite sensor histidine kinase NarX